MNTYYFCDSGPWPPFLYNAHPPENKDIQSIAVPDVPNCPVIAISACPPEAEDEGKTYFLLGQV